MKIIASYTGMKKLSWLMPSGGTILIVLLLIATQSLWAKGGPANESVSNTSTTTISYQGQLTNASGSPLNAPTNMVFKLYAVSSGGTALWTESWTGGNAVDVNDGLFHVMLGSLTAIPQSVIASNNNLWLGITVGGDGEMTPRVQVGSAPFTFQASRAYGLSATDGNPPDAVSVDADGNVVIGTWAGPNRQLNVVGNGSLNLLNTSSAANGQASIYLGSDLGAGRFVIFLAGSGYTYNPAWTNDLNLFTGHDLDINFITSGLARMSIDNGGNIGIGTTNPVSLLHLNQGSNPTGVQWERAGYDTTQIGLIGTGFSVHNVTDNRYDLVILENGNVGIGMTNPIQPLQMGSGAHVTVGGMWTNASDRNLKENFAAINPLWYLEQVAQLPLSTWNYKTEGSEISHIGPMAQDFYTAFGLGEDDKHIGTVDANGVALAAIQGLYQLAQDQQTQIESQQETLTQLTADNTALEAKVTDLEDRLTALEQAIQSGQPVPATGRSVSWGVVLLGVVGAGVWGTRVSKQREISQSHT